MKAKHLFLTVLLALPANAGAAPAAPENRRIVVFDARTPKAQRIALVQKFGVKVVRELAMINAVVISVPATMGNLDTRLKAEPLIMRVDEDYRIVLGADETYAPLPSFREVLRRAREAAQDREPPTPMPGIRNPGADGNPEIPWGVAKVNAPKAWKLTKGRGAKVAVVDTGIDATHPDLAGRVAGGFNAVNSSATAHDDHGHGTHVSGTIAAVLNSTGVAGVAPEATLYAVKVLDANGSGWISDIIAGIEWAANQKVNVINMSLGGPRGNESFHDSIKKAVEAGVAVVCAAGNSGEPRKGSDSSVGYPAAYPEAIAVAASFGKDGTEGLAYFSSRGPEVDFIGPGQDVYSTVPGGGYATYSGTSMASPHLAGLAALAVANGVSGPEAIRAALTTAARKLPGLKPTEQGAGMPDAARIVGVFRVLPIDSSR